MQISPDIQYFDRSRLRRIISSRRNNTRNSCESAKRSSLLLSRKSSFTRKASKKFAISCELETKPIKHQSPKTLHHTKPIPPQSLSIPTHHNNPTKMEPMRKSKTLPASLGNSPNVEHIVQEFESGFMSPRSNFDSGSGNFVKRIVAAFEEKYKTYNDTWSNCVRDKLKDSCLHRHSYSNICQSLQFASIEPNFASVLPNFDDFSSKSSSNEALKVEYRTSAPPKIYHCVNRGQYFEKSPPIDRDETDYSQANRLYLKVNSQNYLQADSQRDSKIEDPQRDPKIDQYLQRDDHYPQRDPKIDEYQKNHLEVRKHLKGSEDPVDQYLESPKIENQIEDLIEDSTLKRKERAPVIIGAFLKKPVKVEEISINWIPFPGKKLPRKKSLKKLLSTLSGKKLNEKKKEVVFSSQVNVNDENRELPDSGYDEQSLSSSSLTSITSTQEVTLRGQMKEERIYANSSAIGNWSTMPCFNRKSTNLSTFQVRGQEMKNETNNNKKKILLYEIPRDEVKVDLGPCYPSPSKIMVKSLDRRCQTKKNVLPPLPKHPMSSSIPKHPFISLSRDELNFPIDDKSEEVVLRKPRECTFNSGENEYDVPRKYLSRSEPGISDVLKFSFDFSLDDMNTTYDVPKLRPKSSVYEDALSLKRRTADFSNTSRSSQDYYSSPSPPQYATIKSRNKRYLSPEVIRTADELQMVSTKVTSF